MRCSRLRTRLRTRVAVCGRWFGKPEDRGERLAGLEGAEEHTERLEREAKVLEPEDRGEAGEVIRPVEAGASPQLGVGEQVKGLEPADAPRGGPCQRRQLVDGQVHPFARLHLTSMT